MSLAIITDDIHGHYVVYDKILKMEVVIKPLKCKKNYRQAIHRYITTSSSSSIDSTTNGRTVNLFNVHTATCPTITAENPSKYNTSHFCSKTLTSSPMSKSTTHWCKFRVRDMLEMTLCCVSLKNWKFNFIFAHHTPL